MENMKVIDPLTSMGAVRLTVSDLDRSRAFYERVIGLSSTERDDGAVALGVGPGGNGAPPLVALYGERSAPTLQRRATGLYHLAVLLPTRRDLAMALARLAQTRWPLDGASDHLVSEALYLSDPEGNGIEIYRDRPREEWPHRDGQLEMATLPLDLDDVVAEIGGATAIDDGVPPGTKIGHVHLQVADLARTEEFYKGVLGFDVMVRHYPGALFVSAGGYHHHLGLNVWHSAGAAPPPTGAVGLRDYEIVLPTQAALDDVLRRVRDAGIEAASVEGGATLVRDPSANGIRLTARPLSAGDGADLRTAATGPPAASPTG
jgi:catechol 2,3-dioxygenase